MNKTEQTLEAIKEKCRGKYGSWSIEIIVYKGEVVGYNEITPFKEKFRAQEIKLNKIESAL